MVVNTENDLVAFVDRLWRKYQAVIKSELRKEQPDLTLIKHYNDAQDLLMETLNEFKGVKE